VTALPTLTHGHVTLRRLAEGDLEELVGAIAHPSVRRWWGFAADPATLREDVRNNGNAFAIEIQGELAGWLGFTEETDPDYRHAALDIFLADGHQGRGFGRSALWLAARWLVDDRGHHRLTIDPARDNRRAIRAYEAVGFRPVGTLRRYERGPDGGWHDNLLMDLLVEELATP
jgi:aminoglycoside 6'-N-acetyltransferase